jgi:hypothetical protein
MAGGQRELAKCPFNLVSLISFHLQPGHRTLSMSRLSETAYLLFVSARYIDALRVVENKHGCRQKLKLNLRHHITGSLVSDKRSGEKGVV